MRMTITKKLILLISIIILFLSTGGFSISSQGMSRLANEVSIRSLSMKLNGDIESFVRAVDQEYGSLFLENGILKNSGDVPLNSYDFIDDFADGLDITATVFQSEGDDFIRLVTNIKKEDGSRVVGTFLGKGSPAYASVMRGERYLGEADILGAHYLTAYDPLFDPGGNLIGILYVGIPVDEITALASSLSSRWLFFLTLVFFIMAFLGLGIGWLMSVRIAGPISDAAVMSERIASGDLTGKIPDSYLRRGDELGDLSRSIMNQIEKLSAIVSQVNHSSIMINQQSRDFSESAQNIASGSANQAASAEEVSASMEEMSANIHQNTENAQETETIASRLSVDAESGGRVVREAVEAMTRIADRITIIEEIARNTNLLALNAAIEAARAGDAGKGFAVVASEVRKLAERSQQAAGEISELSSVTVNKAGAAGDMLNHLVPEILKTSDLIQEISTASREQSSGAEQVNQALMELDSVIQNNASFSETMAESSKELTRQADHLRELMSFFSVVKTNGPVTAGHIRDDEQTDR